MRFFFPAAGLAFTLLAAPAFAQTASCPTVGEQLPELLASAMQRVGREGEVRAEFDVDAQGRVQRISLEGDRHYRSPVRTALQSLDCRAGAPRHYVLNIRFAEPTPSSLAAAKPPLVAVTEQP